MKVLVTGAKGFVGRNLCEALKNIRDGKDRTHPGLEIGEIYDFASALAPRELLIESGRKDKLFPIEASEKAHKKIERIYSLMGAEDKLLIDVFDGKHSVSGRKSFDFLSK